MKVLHLYEVKMLDGASYRGEIAHKDDSKIVLRLRHRSPEQKLRLFRQSIICGLYITPMEWANKLLHKSGCSMHRLRKLGFCVENVVSILY